MDIDDVLETFVGTLLALVVFGMIRGRMRRHRRRGGFLV